jgi:hypothetical protein
MAIRDRYDTDTGYVSGSWDEYVRDCVALANQVLPKEKAPGIIHGDSGGSRYKADVKTSSALVIDSDKQLLPFEDIDAMLGKLPYRYLFTWRSGKFHLVLPLAAPITVDPDGIRERREVGVGFFEDVLDRELDYTTAVANALLHPYTRQTEADHVEVRIGEGPAFDLDEVLAERGYRARTPRKRSDPGAGTYGQWHDFSLKVVEALKAKGCWLDAPARNGRVAVRCPFHPESSRGPGDTSTILFAESGWLFCSHNRCHFRTQYEYLDKLGLAEGDIPAGLRLLLEAAATPRVSLEEASRRIRLALMSARPYERTATVVRVTTGAGKTRAAAEFLDGYCSPRWDAETGDVIPGRSAFFATPTNALLREVSERVHVEHRTVTGVLAVLNDEGSPACRKHDTARRLQQSGGDIHRLMCSPCEYREGCLAREGRVRGEGALTLTNHTLLPSLVREAADGGRVPLIVWDESPPFVEVVRITFSELEWLLDRFDFEDDPRRPVNLARLQEVTAFGERYRVAMRPLIEVLRRMRGGVGLAEAAESYAATRLAESQLARAESMLGIPAAGAAWDRIRAVAAGSNRVNAADLGFDQLSETNQEVVLRAERLASAVVSVLRDGARFFENPGALEVAYLTPAGRLWRDFGGVLLDATAPIHDLRAIRADAEVVDIAVEDAGTGSERVMAFVPRLGRSHLAQDPTRRLESFGAVANHVSRWVRRAGAKRVLVLTYKPFLEEVRAAVAGAVDGTVAVEAHHYGDTRGYDGWFQRGFDTFVTVGDPYSNIVTEDRVYDTLGVTGVSIDDYCAYRARAEAAQAHGRARDPVAAKTGGGRLHLHYGRLPPLGWDGKNTRLDQV